MNEFLGCLGQMTYTEFFYVLGIVPSTSHLIILIREIGGLQNIIILETKEGQVSTSRANQQN